MTLLKGKVALIFGVANERSIAYSIAKLFSENGAKVLLTYPNEAIEKRIKPLAEEIDAEVFGPCDVTKDDELDNVFEEIGKITTNIDILVHSIAFANREDLGNRFHLTSREGFKTALEISSYSLVELSRRVKAFMKKDSSIITMSYYGAEKVIKNYNVMGVAKAALEASVRYLAADLGEDGIRVNAISAGPIKTLAASGISGFASLLKTTENITPLKRNISQEDVAKTALYLCSDLSSGVTGETLYVDAGLNTIGLALD